MLEMILAFVALITIMLAMSIGVLMGRKPIKGSCGGVGAALGEKDYTCDVCGGNPAKCDEQNSSNGVQSQEKNLAYEAK